MRAAILILAFYISCFSIELNAQSCNLEKDSVLYTVGYSHLDTQWRWDYKTTIEKYIWNTLADNFRLLDKYPDYIFNFSGANRYKMMKEYYPKEYERLKDYIKAGRWFTAGSSVEENDVLAASHESIIRQILLGNNYFRKEFGTESLEFMIPDCFGFPASLPSILSHCGITGFSTQKLSWGSAKGIPFNIGKWIGPDGSSVIAALNAGNYTYKPKEDLTQSQYWKDRITADGKTSGIYADYLYHGVGDMGGGTTDEAVEWIEKGIKNKNGIKLLSAKADQLFIDLNKYNCDKLPTYKGELLLTNHSAGSITSAATAKRWNRKNELLAYKAEVSSVIGNWLGGIKYNQDKLNEAWRLVLGSQFHDILPGTSIPRAYDYAWNDQLLAANQFCSTISASSGAVTEALKTDQAKGIPLVVFNPLSLEREDVVEATVSYDKAPKFIRVYNSRNEEVPSQIAGRDNKGIKILFIAKVPSMSYSLFDVRSAKSGCSIQTAMKVTKSSLENGKYIVKLNKSGDVESIYDKIAKKELLSEPVRLSFQFEKPEEWPAWNMDWKDRQQPPAGFVDGPAAIRIIENGPARIGLEITRESRNSKIIQQIRLGAQSSGDRVEFNNTIYWATKESSLKASFPLSVSNSLATYNLGAGTVERGNNDSLKFEVPSHQWFDLTDKSGSYGVSILEDCKYGSDKPSDNTLRLTLLYTPGVRQYYKDQAYQDMGEHNILFALYGHQGNWNEANSNSQALRLNQPLIAFQTARHGGTFENEIKFLECSNDNVVVSALKKAENSDEIILRVVETKGNSSENVSVKFINNISSAREVNGQEKDKGNVLFSSDQIKFNITPYQLKTFAVKLDDFTKKPLQAESRQIALPFNKDVFSSDNKMDDGNFDNEGRTIPSELIPEKVLSENIEFNMGPVTAGQKNAVECEGQRITLPEGSYNSLYVLAASSGKLSEGTFILNGKKIKIPVQDWSGFIGQWDTRMWNNYSPRETDYRWDNAVFSGITPAYLRKDNVDCFTTHRHLKSGNDTYAYAYIYKYRIELPENTREVFLPNNKDIKIFAMTVSNENNSSRPVTDLFDTLERNQEEFNRFSAVK